MQQQQQQSTQINEEKLKTMIKKAQDMKALAYAKYSKFRVGCCLETKNGELFSGCNIENVSYGLTNCAERTAIFKAVSEGITEFSTVVVASDLDDFIFPCGACRQVILEFGQDINVVVTNLQGQYKMYKISELIPSNFQPNALAQFQKQQQEK